MPELEDLIPQIIQSLKAGNLRRDFPAFERLVQQATVSAMALRAPNPIDIMYDLEGGKYRAAAIVVRSVTGHVAATIPLWPDRRTTKSDRKRMEPAFLALDGWLPEPMPDDDGRSRRHYRPRKPKGLTDKQSEAVLLVGEHKGNIAAAARASGITRKTMKQHYDAAHRKLGRLAMPKSKTRSLAEDHRGQMVIASDDDGLAAPKARARAPRDNRLK